jgi:hypothetical protein
MERQGFEDSWKEAFKDSEVIPSDNVWTNVELDLERAKATILRKRLVRYQLLAAASILFSIGVGVSVFVSNKNDNQNLVATTQSPVTTKSSESVKSATEKSTDFKNQAADATSNNKIAEEKNQPLIKSEQTQANSKKVTNENTTAEIEKNNALRNEIFISSESTTSIANTYPEVPSSVANKKATLVAVSQPVLHVERNTNADPVALMMAKLERREKEIAGEQASEENPKKNLTEKLWSSVGVAAGSFRSVNSGASPSLANSATNSALASSIANQETKASGVAYSMGVNLGKKIAERWIVQGGFNYLNQTSEYTQQSLVQTQNFTAFRPASISELNQLAAGDAPDQKTAITSAPYDVNNNVRYLSIPVQAGYLIINRGVGLQMNAGVSTDLFLQNTISATSDGERVDPVKAGIGQNSAFRPWNFSGLMGTEVSYKFGKHYRIALNPGLRYPFSSIYKSDFYKSSRLTYDIGLRFRYIFH